MSDESVQATETATGDTNVSEQVTTEETPATTEDSSQETQATSTEEGEETAAEETPAFIEYDFDKDVKLPEGYELPDASKSALNDMGKELNIPADKVQLVVDKFISVNEQITTAQQEEAVKQYEKDQATRKDTLLKDWGDDFVNNQASNNKVLNRFFPDSLDHMFGEVEEGKIRDLNTRDFMPVHFEKGLLEIGRVMSPDTLETGQPSTNQNKGLKDKFSDLNQQYKT